jgi:UPF0271 protein
VQSAAAAPPLSAPTVRLNLDAAELDDEPDDLTPLAHLLNLACGAHAGDVTLATRALRRAQQHRVPVGAHPSYPDREGFGRRAMDLSTHALQETLRAQLSWLRDLAHDEGLGLSHVKPHGALYHAATARPDIAECLCDVTADTLGAVTLVGIGNGALHAAARARGWLFLREGFADRGYTPEGGLIPRGAPGDVLTDLDAVRAQVRRLVRAGEVDTVCVHGDGVHALPIARAVREALA